MKGSEFPEFVHLTKSLIEILKTDNGLNLENSGFMGPSSSEEYLSALRNYLCGRKVTCIPEVELLDIELYPTKNQHRLRADVDLWVDGEKSDLTAILYFLTSESNGKNKIELYDLRVL
jgi:hypothetical protein